MDNLIFEIAEYADHTYKIETKHIAYHFRDGFSYDNLTAEQVLTAMNTITEMANNKYKVGACFVVG